MEPHPDYFSLPHTKHARPQNWNVCTPPNLPPNAPVSMPIWQYTAVPADFQVGVQVQIPHNFQYYPHDSPSPFSNNPASSVGSVQSSVNSPQLPFFQSDPRFTPLTPIYDAPANIPTQPQFQLPIFGEKVEREEMIEDEESDEYSWDPLSPTGPPRTTNGKNTHRRTKSASEASARNAKRAHTVVERNYRERLNDKIADLGLYLFETSSDSRTKPSKSLVMTRAKERLQQLESRNKSLEAEVAKLRQHIAILDHIVGSQAGGGEVGFVGK